MGLKSKLSEYFNLLGYRTNRHIVVLESDDWGSQRFTKETREEYLSMGVDIGSNWMSRFDCLESIEDVDILFDCLDSLRGSRPAKITLIFNPANPDFERIQSGNFSKYFFKPFDELVKEQNSGDEKLVDLYRSFLSSGQLELAFHGREHLYVNRWLRDLRRSDPIALTAFKNKVWGLSSAYLPAYNANYRAAFELDEKEDLVFQRESITSGMQLMKNIFKTKIRYFVAPNGPFSLSLLNVLEDNKIEYIGLSRNFLDVETKKRGFYWLGKKVAQKMRVINRNCLFEPSSPRSKDWVSSCLKDIDSAFRWKKPAVISTHRANYVGNLEESNRHHGMIRLRTLLESVQKNWPDTIFLTSSELGDIVSGKRMIDEFS